MHASEKALRVVAKSFNYCTPSKHHVDDTIPLNSAHVIVADDQCEA